MESTGREFSYEGYKRGAFQCFPFLPPPKVETKEKELKDVEENSVVSVFSRLPEHFLSSSSSARGMGLLSREVTAERDIP